MTPNFYFIFPWSNLLSMPESNLVKSVSFLELLWIERYLNYHDYLVKHLKEDHLFRERARWPPIFISFSPWGNLLSILESNFVKSVSFLELLWIERYSNYHNYHVKHLKGDHLFREQARWPPIFISFSPWGNLLSVLESNFVKSVSFLEFLAR